ncbi:MAG: hypothetical protein WCE64_14640 [Bacteroidales bacterium]
MTPFLTNIRTVARYEAKTLRRSWFFRLFSIGALFIFTILNIGFFSPVGDEMWGLVAIPSSVPLVNLYMLNIGQAMVVIFLAADFLKRDKKLDTNEVLYTRSMSNFEYITGKTWGILRLFLGLDIVILSIGLLMNIISQSMRVDIMSYLYYLLIICVPTIVFSLGLAFMLMQVIRNQAITFMILLGYAVMDMFYLWFRAGSVFDYMAFGLPLFKSGMIGFDNLNFIISQRLMYLFLGLMMVMMTILLFRRLPQSKFHSILTVVLMVFFLAGAGWSGLNVSKEYMQRSAERKLVIETNRKYENLDFPSVTAASIEYIQKEESFDAVTDLKIINDNETGIKSYIFSLNPSLNVTKVISGSAELPFRRSHHIIEIDAGKTLRQGEKDTLRICYSGSINEPFCYPGCNDNLKETPYRTQMLNINKRQSFLTPGYVLLTPAAHWYPVAGLNYYPSNPARIKIDFTKYSLRVRTIAGLSAVSQGIASKDDDFFTFNPETPLTGLTLAIGRYRTDTITVDSIRYLSYHYPGNDYYKKDLAGLKDTLPFLISGIMRDLESNFSVKYPFKTLSLLEVPVQYYSYPEQNTQTRGEVQPSMVLLPEKLATLQDAGFRKNFQRRKKRNARNNQVMTDKELQVMLFNNFIRNTFISGENFRYSNGVAWNEPKRYRLGPSFYFFRNNFYSMEFPVINTIFESHLQKVTQDGSRGEYYDFYGRLSDNDKANLNLRGKSFRELLAANPGGDTLRTVLTLKGDYFFNLLRARAGIGEFNKWFRSYLDTNKFRSVDIKKMNEGVRARFGFEFYPYLSDWFNRKEQPGFLFSDLKAEEIIVGDRSRYQVTFIAANPEPVAGLFNFSFRTGGAEDGRITATYSQGPRGGSSMSISMQGRGMEASDISRIVLLGPGEARKITYVLDAQPRTLLINTLVSKNIPGEISLPFDEVKKERTRTHGTGEDVVLSTLPREYEQGEIIVDNEDAGFKYTRLVNSSPLKKLLGVEDKSGDTYEEIRMTRAPEHWQPVVSSEYYGRYVRSSVYRRSGTGKENLQWTSVLTKPGYYDVYAYVGKTVDGMIVNKAGQGGPPPPEGGQSPCKDLHYRIFNDQGTDEITLDYQNAENGWNNLGRYYISSDTARVILTDQSAGSYIIGDAVKWVKVD